MSILNNNCPELCENIGKAKKKTWMPLEDPDKKSSGCMIIHSVLLYSSSDETPLQIHYMGYHIINDCVTSER